MEETAVKEQAEQIVEKKEEWHHVVTVEDLGGLKRKIKIVYDTTGVKMAFDKACDLIGAHVQISGFRKGKAPKPLVQAHFREKIKEYAGELLAKEGYLHACFEQKFMALGEPKFENKEFGVDGTFGCDAVIEIRPEIKPSGYVGLQLKKPKADAGQLFNRNLDAAREQHASEKACDDVQPGRTATVSFVARVEGKEISSGKDHQFLIQNGQAAPFGENLCGMKVGETGFFELTAPEGTEQAGQITSVEVTVTGITEKVPPTDTELAERTQAPSYEALIDALKKKAELDAMQQARQILEEEAIDRLLEMHQFDVPPGWVEEEEKYFMAQLGMSAVPDESIKGQIHNMAERNVRRSFMLEAIYEAEPNLRVTKEEFDATIEAEAERQQVSRLLLLDDLKKRNMIDGVVAMIKHKKVMDLVIGQANLVAEDGTEAGSQECCEIPENPLG